jgi:putative colanic acid biosynthesis acetyltransferase WcaF
MSNKNLNIDKCRTLRPYSFKEYLGRILWVFINPLFRFSPRVFFGWRRFLLRLFGAQIGYQANIYPTVRIYLPWNLTLGNKSSIGEWALIYNLGRITIEDSATISHQAHLCAGTHDYSDSTLPLIRLPIHIGAQAWICADAFIGPGVTVGEGAVVGASSVVVKDIPPWNVYAGNPSKFIKTRTIKN